MATAVASERQTGGAVGGPVGAAAEGGRRPRGVRGHHLLLPRHHCHPAQGKRRPDRKHPPNLHPIPPSPSCRVRYALSMYVCTNDFVAVRIVCVKAMYAVYPEPYNSVMIQNSCLGQNVLRTLYLLGVIRLETYWKDFAGCTAVAPSFCPVIPSCPSFRRSRVVFVF